MHTQSFCIFCGRYVYPADLVILGNGTLAHESCAEEAKKKDGD